MTRRSVLVVGASGFIGGAVVDSMRAAGHDISTMAGIRIPAISPQQAVSYSAASPLVAHLASRFQGFDAVVNAAGNPNASETRLDASLGPNGVLPGLLASGCRHAQPSPRFVHVSTAVVQGRAPRLDTSAYTEAFSAYAESKIMGEELALNYAPRTAVVYRPPSVHAPDRRVTQGISAVARSPLASVARPGSSPSPQALLANVAAAITFLATCPQQPPTVVLHPWEGLTTASLMTLLGDRAPRELPRWLAQMAVAAATAGGRYNSRLAANARRLEMLWFGQAQVPSWLSEVGWKPPEGLENWAQLGAALAASRGHHAQRRLDPSGPRPTR